MAPTGCSEHPVDKVRAGIARWRRHPFGVGQGRPRRFWNLTQDTISKFYLATAGTTAFDPNQCKMTGMALSNTMSGCALPGSKPALKTRTSPARTVGCGGTNI
jgi:hypothetical protein